MIPTVNPRSAARAAGHLLRDALGQFGELVEALIPAQAVRCALGRDSDAAVGRAAAPYDVEELLADAEERDEVLEPGWQIGQPGRLAIMDALAEAAAPATAKINHVDLIEVPYAAGKAAKAEVTLTSPPEVVPPEYDVKLTIERPEYPKDACRPTGPHSDSAVPGSADPSRLVPPGRGADPAGAGGPPAPAPAGSPELVELIAEVLAEHHDYSVRWEAVICVCGEPLTTDGYPDRRLRDHVAPLIAARIEKATPAAPFTHGRSGHA